MTLYMLGRSSAHSIDVSDSNDRQSVRVKYNERGNVLTSYVLHGVSVVKRSAVEGAGRRLCGKRIIKRDVSGEEKPEALKLNVVGQISNRFVETIVTSVMKNTQVKITVYFGLTLHNN